MAKYLLEESNEKPGGAPSDMGKNKSFFRMVYSRGLLVLYRVLSEFHRQTFRADSMIKNKQKTLNIYGVKNA
jgi:hypothetical protein